MWKYYWKVGWLLSVKAGTEMRVGGRREGVKVVGAGLRGKKEESNMGSLV